MSSDFYVNVGIRDEKGPAVCEGLIRRLVDPDDIYNVEVHVGDWFGPEQRHVRIHGFMNTMPGLVEGAFQRNESALIGVCFRLQSGRRITDTSLWISGARRFPSWGWYGTAHITVGMRGLYEPLAVLEEVGETSISPRWTQARDTIESDARQLFFTALGAPEASEPGSTTDHAAAHVDGLWPSPLFCCGVFHRNVREYARDFARIHAERKWSVVMPGTLDGDICDWEHSPQLMPKHGDERRRPMDAQVYDRLAGTGRVEMARFLARLTDDSVRSAASIPPDQVRDALLTVEADVPEVGFHEFPNGSLALWTSPRGFVWKVYAKLADLLL